MRTINLIPAKYEGNPRNALGYNWEKLVMDGYAVDKEKSVPGEELNMSAEECYAMLEANHGPIAIRDKSSGEAKTRDGKTVNIDGLTPVATINGMWCGGISVTVYAVADATANESAVTTEPMMITGAEAVVFDAVMASIEDKDNEGENGYCKKCQTYCYGDCDANQ